MAVIAPKGKPANLSIIKGGKKKAPPRKVPLGAQQLPEQTTSAETFPTGAIVLLLLGGVLVFQLLFGGLADRIMAWIDYTKSGGATTTTTAGKITTTKNTP